MKKIIVFLFAAFLILCFVELSSAATTQVDALIEKLMDKGILTRQEAIKLKGEIAADEKLLREEGLKTSLPEWVRKMRLKGDFRLRYQYERKFSDDDGRTRGRIRYRLGVETDVIDNVKVGAGLASGADDPRSTNQTFQDTFERNDIRLDYAFAEWKALTQPNDKLNLIGGIFPKSVYLWNPTDLLWDTDINPQGGALSYEHKFNDNLASYVNSGVLVIDEVTSTTGDKIDPFMNFVQGGLKWKKGAFSSNVAGTYYAFNGVQGSCPDWSAATNTGITSASSGSCTGALKYDYDSVSGAADFAYAKPFGLPLEEVAIFGETIHNIDGTGNAESNGLDESFGWATGLRFGDPKVNGKGQWQAKYIFANMQKDAWPDFMPDSDRYGGRTGVRAHEAILEFGLTKNVTVVFDYYQARRIKTTPNREHLIQADFNFKF